MPSLDDHSLNQLFRAARSVHAFTATPIDDGLLRALYELLKWGPTAFNCQPGRYVFVRSADAKKQLAPALLGNNLEKTLKAPVTVIVAYDSRFFENLPAQFPSQPEGKAIFEGRPGLIEPTALQNSSLQAAYLILAARALGLGAGPMSGFDQKKVDDAFFPDGRWRSTVLVNLGYWDGTVGAPRGPRLTYEEVVRVC